MSGVTCHVSCVMCRVSHVVCQPSPVTCHLSLTLTATASDPSPAKSPIIHSRLVRKDPRPKNAKYHWNNQNPKTSVGIPIIGICFSTRNLQSTGKQVFCDGTSTHTHNIQTSRPRDWIFLQFSSNVGTCLFHLGMLRQNKFMLFSFP